MGFLGRGAIVLALILILTLAAGQSVNDMTGWGLQRKIRENVTKKNKFCAAVGRTGLHPVKSKLRWQKNTYRNRVRETGRKERSAEVLALASCLVLDKQALDSKSSRDQLWSMNASTISLAACLCYRALGPWAIEHLARPRAFGNFPMRGGGRGTNAHRVLPEGRLANRKPGRCRKK